MESINIHCSALFPAKNRTISLTTPTEASDSFTFVVIADPQLGLLEQYVEKRPPPRHWDREVDLVNRAVSIINRLSPKPGFVVVCGDLVNDEPGFEDRDKQTSDLLVSLSHLKSDIPLIVLPGNHDVGNCPNIVGVKDYISVWGDDYFSFIFNRVRFLVLNTQYLWDDSKCESIANEFRQWFYEQLSLKNKDFDTSIVFQHIPFFLNDINEPDDYFNIPIKYRKEIVDQLHKNGIYYAFSGHLHKNNISTYTPSIDDNNNVTKNMNDNDGSKKNNLPFSMISSSSVCVQLGNDQPGIRLVHISKPGAGENCLQHAYWSLDELEKILASGKQPEFK